MRRVASLLLLTIAVSVRGGDVQPCTSPLAMKPAPCASDVIATLDGKPIRLSDLDAASQKRITAAKEAIANARATALREDIADAVIAREAARRGVTPAQLVYDEVNRKVAPATSAKIYDRRLAAREKAFVDSLLAKSPLTLKEGPRSDFALLNARIDAVEAERDAVNDLVRNRVTNPEGHTVKYLFEIPRRPFVQVADDRAPFTGSKNATVTLVEFGDFQCPPCGYMASVLDEVLPAYGDRVRYIFRQSPMSMHAHAWKAAEASLAAHAQGKFFPYAHKLFTNQEALDVASLKRYAREVGLDVKRFDNDLDSGRFAVDVLADKRAGERARVPGTPVFFINGIRGGEEVYSAEGMRAALDAALKSK